MAKKAYVTPDAGATWVEVASSTTDLSSYALKAGPTFTGTVVLPSTTSIGDVSSTELSYVDGVTSAIQTQLDTKSPLASPTFTGSVTIPAGTINSGRLGACAGGQGTTTSGANLTITHGLNVTPSGVTATIRSNAYSSTINNNIYVGNIGSTTFTVFANNGAGGVAASAFAWVAVA